MSLRTPVVIGVAALALFSALGLRQRVGQHATVRGVACPPQWLPALLAFHAYRDNSPGGDTVPHFDGADDQELCRRHLRVVDDCACLRREGIGERQEGGSALRRELYGCTRDVE